MSLTKVTFTLAKTEFGFVLNLESLFEKIIANRYDDGEFVFDPYLGFYNDEEPESTVRSISKNWELMHFLKRMMKSTTPSFEFVDHTIIMKMKVSRNFRFYGDNTKVELNNFDAEIILPNSSLDVHTRDFIKNVAKMD